MRIHLALGAIVVSLLAASSAEAVSVTISGPPSGTQRYYVDPGLPVSATADTSGCGKGNVWVNIITKGPSFPLALPIGSSLNKGSYSTTFGPSAVGVHEWWGRMNCPNPANNGEVIVAESEHRTLIVTDKRVVAPKPTPKKKVTKKQKRAVLKKVVKTATRSKTLSKRGRQAQKSYANSKAPAPKKTLGDVLKDIEKFFKDKDELKKQFDKAFPKKKQSKQEFPSSVGQAGAGFRAAQLKAMPDFVKALEKLGDFRNVAVRSADNAAAANPEVLKQLDLASSLYGQSGTTWAMLTPQQKGDVATQFSILVQTGAAKRLVNEMVEAGKAGTNVTFAH
jgi:hypothetical protein